MNITGEFMALIIDWNYIASGAFKKIGAQDQSWQYKGGDNAIHFGFDASRSWTGETSAVGGGASHTHGIKKYFPGNN